MRSYTAIYALLYTFFALGAGVAPAVFGWSVDRSGSYAGVLLAAFVALVFGACALLGLGRYREPAVTAAAA
jgi:MFS family permease